MADMRCETEWCERRGQTLPETEQIWEWKARFPGAGAYDRVACCPRCHFALTTLYARKEPIPQKTKPAV